MTGRLLARTAVEELTGLSRSSIYRQMRQHKFPEPIGVGDHTARSRISTGYFPGRRCSVMAPSSQGLEHAQYPGRFSAPGSHRW